MSTNPNESTGQSEGKLVDVLKTLIYRSLQWENGEIKGWDERMVESLAPILLKPFIHHSDELIKQEPKHLRYTLKQAYEGLRIASNVLNSQNRETAADRQIDFSRRLVSWFIDDCKGEMPKWIP